MIPEIPALDKYVKENKSINQEILDETEIVVKYQSYIDKEQINATRISNYDKIKLPANFDYMEIKAISYEGREKLNKLKPETIGQASRISGISPADISVLMVYLEKRK